MESKPEIRNSFPRCFRLSRREGFSQVLKQTALICRWFSIYSQPNNLGCNRLGVTVSKRLVASAVQRNEIKRLIRECFRTYNLKGTEKDVVIRLRKRIDRNDWEDAISKLRDSLGLVLLAK